MTSTLIRYTAVWFALALVAVANGMLRVSTYGTFLTELTAHQVSTLTGMLFSATAVWYFQRLWPIGSAGQAWLIGVSWLVLTVTFEFAFGHYMIGHSWAHLFADYRLLEGRLWLVFLAWLLVMPYLAYALSRR